VNTSEAWCYLDTVVGVSEDTLKVVTSLNGYSLGTLEDVLYVVTGYRSFEQIREASE